MLVSYGSTIAVARHLVGKISFLNKLGVEQGTVSLEGSHSWISDIDWSPVNGLLMFVSDDSQGRSAIWTIHSDGRDQKGFLSTPWKSRPRAGLLKGGRLLFPTGWPSCFPLQRRRPAGS